MIIGALPSCDKRIWASSSGRLAFHSVAASAASSLDLMSASLLNCVGGQPFDELVLLLGQVVKSCKVLGVLDSRTSTVPAFDSTPSGQQVTLPSESCA